MERSDTAVDDYIASIADEAVRSTISCLDEVIAEALPGRRRTVWEGVFWGGTEQTIIGYGEIVQRRPKGASIEWFAVGLARQSKHYSVYVNAVEDGAYLGHRFADRLGKVKIGAASIGFRRLDDIDLNVLAELCRRAHELTPPDERL